MLRYQLVCILECSGEHSQELGPVHLAERLDGKEKFLVALAAPKMMPHAVLVHTATGNDTVYVRMVIQIGSPCVEDARHAALQSLSLIKLSQRMPG